MDAALYLVGTPIGNLADMTYRAVTTLREADVILAGDTRHSRILLNHYEISTPMISCHKFNEARRLDLILERLARGQAVAMITDAGMPCVSDPGARVVSACREAGFQVTVIPGPSAALSAFALAGFPDARFYFEGFLPHKSGKRNKRLEWTAALGCPVIFFESPYRLLKLMGELEPTWGPDCEVVVCRELTKKFEQTVAGKPSEVTAYYTGRAIKGELVVVAYRPEGVQAYDAEGI